MMMSSSGRSFLPFATSSVLHGQGQGFFIATRGRRRTDSVHDVHTLKNLAEYDLKEV